MTFHDFNPTLLDALIKVTILLGAAAIISLSLRRASAAARHMVWTFALCGAVVLPALSMALPRWQLPLVTLASPAIETPGSPTSPSAALPIRRPAVDSASTEPAAVPVSASPRQAGRWTLSGILFAIWIAGTVLVIGRLLLGLAAVQWVTRRTARGVIDAPWLPLAVALASELGVAHRIRFKESRAATMPIAFGIFRSTVLMPADASRWPVERLRIVLLHELAHVKRRDCLTHAIAQIACAAYWFNPLAWIAATHMKKERERACDDLVLAFGTRRTDYAAELLEIARAMRAGRFPALMAGATLAMAHRSQLEGRLIAILDPKTPRTTVTRVRALAAAAAVVCALPPLAAVQPWVVAQASPAQVAEVPQAAAPVVSSAPSPSPSPAPAPSPSARPRASQIGPTAVDAPTLAQSVAEGVAQGLQAPTQVEVQGIVLNALQGAVEGVAAALGQEKTGGRQGADPRTVAALTAALKDSDKEVRETAMHALVQLRDPSIFEPLVQALKDVSPDVREQAVHALGQLRDKRAVEPVIGMLKDQSASVREQSAFALGQLRDPRAVEVLIPVLKDSSASVREQAAFALGQLRDKRATAALNEAVKDASDSVREQAVFALGQIRDVTAIEGLIAALRDTKPDVRQQAAFALGQIRDARAVEPLISALKDSNADVRQQAAFGLGQLRDRAAVEALVIAVKDPDADVREQVVFALGQLRDPRAIDALTVALKDASADVRQKAAFALGQIAR